MNRRHIAILLSAVFFVSGNLLSAPKISIRSADKLDSYTKVYVVGIRNDKDKVQPRIVERTKKMGFDTVDLNSEHLPFTSQGTGFILSPEGLVLTCAHVVGKEANATLWLGTNRYIGRVTAIDTNLDVALIALEGDHPPFTPLVFTPSPELRIGQEVFTMGFPEADLLGSKPRLDKGMINSTVGEEGDERHVSISVPIQPGNSGSPLLDDQGRLVGMVSSTMNALRMLLLEGAVPQNVNFAIKPELLRKFLEASKVSLDQATNSAVKSVALKAEDISDNAARSLVLIRGGIVDEQRLKERPLLCRCLYSYLVGHQFFRLRIDFVDVRKLKLVLTANLDQSSTSSEDKVLDAMFEKISDNFFPDKVNPFNPKKAKK